nr:hypothetical protein CFP56_64986 [Quercus suber]
MAFHHLQNRLKRQGKVSVRDWITFWYRGNGRYLAPRKPARRTTIPKCSQNPFGVINKRGPWSDKEHGVFVDLQVEGDLKEETYLSALLSCWLCIFVFPIKDPSSIRPYTFKIASSMANGRLFGLAAPVLASIYRGLNTISSSPTLSKSGASFAIHYVYAWIAHFFRSNRITNDKLSDPLMTKYSGVGYVSPFSEFSARKHIRTANDFLWHGTAFKKSYDQTFIDNDHLSIQKFDYFMSLRSGRVRHSYKQWWEGVCENDFTKGTNFLANIASFHVKSLTPHKSQKGKRELQDPYIPQPLSEFARHPLEDDRHSKDSSRHTGVARSQGTKGSLVVLAKDAIEISEEKVCNDLDYDWKHSKSPMRGVDAETSIDHAPFLTNSESSISKPSAESSDFKRRKFADVGTSSKLLTETGKTFLSSLQVTNPPEVSMFQAIAHISSVRRKGVSMLGDVLLNKLSTLSVDNILPQVEINEIYSGIESLGVDPRHLREHVDKHCEGVADFLRMKESLNKRPSPVNLIQHEAEIELLLSEASHKKASLKTELDTIRLRMTDLRTELVQLEESASQIESHQVKQDDVMQALEEQLEEVKSTLVLEDQDMKALEKIRALLEDNCSSLKDLKWML